MITLIIITVVIVPALFLARRSDDNLAQYTEDVIKSLTDNANFPTTLPTTATVQTALDNFRDALSKLSQRELGSAVLRDEKRDILEGLLRNLAANCVSQANGDLAKYLTSGMAARRTPSSAGTLPAPLNFHFVLTGNDEQLRASCKKVANNHGYEFYIGTDAAHPETWTNKKTSSSTKVLFTDLVSGTKYFGRCRAVGAKGTFGDWSPISSKTCP